MKIKTFIQDVEFFLDQDLHDWYTKSEGKEVGPDSIWHWHPVVSKEMSAFILMCKEYQYDSFIDIGAHCGIFSSVYCSIVKNHSCYSIEPVKEHIDKIKKISQLNNFSIDANQIGLHNYIGENRYYGNHMVNFIDEDFKKKDLNFSEDTEVFSVKIDTLDHFVSEKNIKPSLIKLDVEGYEIPILEKSVNTISSCGPDFLIETHRDECKLLGWNIDSICDFIKEDDYELYTYDLSAKIENLKKYVNDFESNMRFVAFNKKTRGLV